MKPKPPEIAGSIPMRWAWLAGLTWYHGGAGLIVAFVLEAKRDEFEALAKAAGYYAEAAEPYDFGGLRKVRFELREFEEAD